MRNPEPTKPIAPISPLARLVSIEQAAAVIGFTPRGVWDLVRQGRIKSVSVGRLRKIPVAELDRICNEGVPRQGAAS